MSFLELCEPHLVSMQVQKNMRAYYMSLCVLIMQATLAEQPILKVCSPHLRSFKGEMTISFISTCKISV